MKFSSLIVIFSLSLIFSSILFGGGFEDDFSSSNKKGRAALRGDWIFENNTASCVADPELYKKFADHGPILRWPIEMTDGVVSFEFQPKGCQKIILTLNEAGHVFRIILMDGKNEKIKSRALGWTGSSKTSKPEPLAREGIPTIAELEGEWTEGRIEFAEGKATVKIGEFSQTLEHASASRAKSEFTIGFAFGEMAVRNVKVATAE